MRYYAILNPVSGKGQLQHIESKIKQTFDRLGMEGELVKTISPGDASHLARIGLKKGYSTFLCFGGDGTLFEVVNGLRDAPVSIGVIPLGEQNLFARTLGCDKHTWSELLTQYHTLPRTTMVDVGQMNEYLFLNFIGFGISVNILAESMMRKSQHVKKRSWMENMTQTLKKPDLHEAFITKDDKCMVSGQMYDVQIINTTNFFFHEGKNSITHQDRLLDLVIIDKSIGPGKAREIRNSRILPATEGISHLQGKVFEIIKPYDITLQIDSEIIRMSTPITVDLAPFQMRFFQPQKFN